MTAIPSLLVYHAESGRYVDYLVGDSVVAREEIGCRSDWIASHRDTLPFRPGDKALIESIVGPYPTLNPAGQSGQFWLIHLRFLGGKRFRIEDVLFGEWFDPLDAHQL
jgi:hypothetical protein